MPLNNLNKTLNKVNRATQNLNQTQRNVRNIGQQTGIGQNRNNRNNRNTQNQPQAADNIWKCSCGKANTSKFCGDCGKAPAKCTSCDIIVETKFCPECGGAIEA